MKGKNAMSETNDILCPHCNVENSRNRLTCQICGERLSPGSTRLYDPPKKKRASKAPIEKAEAPKPNKSKDAIEPSKDEDTLQPSKDESPPYDIMPGEVTYWPPPEEVTYCPPPIKIITPPEKTPHTKRKGHIKHRISTKSPDPIFFILDGGKLKPIKINWGVIKPLRRKDISQQARNMLSLYNRSKDLLK
jgi:hypothetical protein